MSVRCLDVGRFPDQQVLVRADAKIGEAVGFIDRLFQRHRVVKRAARVVGIGEIGRQRELVRRLVNDQAGVKQLGADRQAVIFKGRECQVDRADLADGLPPRLLGISS